MISQELLKEIIIENENFILHEVGEIISRHNILLPKKLNKVKVFYGPRRCGKTFFLYDIFRRNNKNALYIDFEDERLHGIELKELDKIKDCFFELKPSLIRKRPIVFLFDEIQNINGWEKFARRLVEREGIDLYVAGSSSQINPAYLHSSLRGREWSIMLYPFSFLEFLAIKNISLENAFYGRQKSLIRRHLREYIKYGGFPEVTLAQSGFVKTKLLDEYLYAMFFKDLVEQFKIKNIILLETLKEALFSSYSKEFSLNSFLKHYRGKFPFSKTKLFQYYKHFLASMLIFEVRLFSRSTYRQMRNPPKIYLIDTGLAYRSRQEDYGRVLENIVFLELKRSGYDISYYKDKNECDFIIKRVGFSPFAVQVTWEITDENREREYNGIIQASQFLKQKKGIIITANQDYEVKKEGINISVISLPRWLKQ